MFVLDLDALLDELQTNHRSNDVLCSFANVLKDGSSLIDKARMRAGVQNANMRYWSANILRRSFIHIDGFVAHSVPAVRINLTEMCQVRHTRRT